jgi:hypothetical protein
MKTIKTLNLLALLIVSTMSMACTQGMEQEVAVDSEFGLETLEGSKGDSMVVQAGTTDAEAILAFANQPLADGAAFLELVDSRLYSTAAKNIAKYRSGDDAEFGTADDQTFGDLEALDAVPYVGPAALRALLTLAQENGYPRPLSLRDGLQRDYAQHTYFEYRPAREHLFSHIDSHDGWVEGVYTGLLVETMVIPDHTIMNTEHTWPKSRLSGAAETDLHHLFPTSSYANSKRSSFRFGNVISPSWQQGGSKLGQDIEGNVVFEVRASNRGNAARAMFYIAVMYAYEIPANEEATLRAWSEEDPVDAVEQARNNEVEIAQGNRNPFVDSPELVGQITDF